MMMEEEIKSLIKVWILALASLSYCYFIVGKIPKGKTRFFFLLPILFYFTILPSTISFISLKGVIAFFFTWLANFKLLLLCFDQGPLSSNQPKSSLKSFISIACLPIKIKQDDPSLKSPYSNIKNKKNPSHQNKQSNPSHHHLETPPKPFLSLPIIILLTLLVVHLYCTNNQIINPSLLLVLYLYLSLEIVLAIGATLARATLGLELELQSNEPYLSPSLQDFWGRRWNLMITEILRPTVYHPTRRISTRIFGRKWASLPAVLVTFLVSGLMHELILFYMNKIGPTWEVTWFFVLHGICTAMEIGVKRALAGKWQLHRLVSGPLAVGFVVVTTMWYFLPPVVRSGSDLGIKESGAAIEFFREKLISAPKLLHCII
ncbi:hypothetical protein BVC80_157g4 [Macleaya cordata]|uniref:Wax synthase domain-containing protein n=1 Tax=Macleaya cordata TaxID=56857 RepID=A0A200RBX2_MACCD|nr:hypothetical protein BVC80_157g4 [Macleaya cordata]